MSTLFQDNFDLQLDGGWDPHLGGFSVGIYFDSQIREFSDGGVFSPHKWFEFDGSDLQNARDFPAGLKNLDFYFAYNSLQFTPGLVFQVYANSAIDNMTRIPVARLSVESDMTLSGYVGGSPNVLIGSSLYGIGYGNSGLCNIPVIVPRKKGFVLETDAWYFFEIGVSYGFFPITKGGITLNYLQVGIDCVIDGAEWFNGDDVSNFYLDTSFEGGQTAAGGMKAMGWSGEMGLSQITCNSGDGIPNWGNPKPIISQMISEPGGHENPTPRVSQMAIELSDLPNTAHPRVTQMVIELATHQSIFPPSEGWKVYES